MDSDQMRHHARTTIVTACIAAVVAVGAPAQAFSGGGTTNDNGYGARVEVHLSGDVSQGAVGSVPGPPPMCWWENLSGTMLSTDKVDTSDPAAVKKYYEEKVRPYLTGHAATGQLAIPSEAYFKNVIAQVKAGQPMTFYSLQIRDEALGVPGSPEYADAVHTIGQACGTPVTNGPFGPVLTSWQAFAPGQVPEPAVAPEDLAEYAYEVMDLKRPTLEWNPHLASADDATLVNLPTWLWTQDPAAVEQRQVTAEAAGISVTVTAEPNGMTVTSPVAGTDCSAEQARTAYAPGVDESQACIVTFPRGSAAYGTGFPVQSTTGWQAAWTSNAGPGGDLEPKTRSATTTIPVIEVQSRVSQVS
ncbi:MAG: hypothetical protein ABWY19_05675 [Marmoricola sp.]